MMNIVFAIIAALTIAAAVAAMSLRNLVHCALALALAFAGIAATYLQLGAQFVGFTQLLVYVGAVAILVVFAILLTRGSESPEQPVVSSGWTAGIIVTVAVLGILVYAIGKSPVIQRAASPQADATVREIGTALMNKFVLPLEVVGLLLTAALIGAVIIAMKEEGKK
jgi:NADH:ubiquinone oxidoreductase subunit 6 (subunit J)